jgi:hypothetical protein
MRFVEFKVVGREESIWLNPASIRSIQTRQGGPRRHTIIRYVGLPDEAQLLVDCDIRDVVERLSGGLVPA